MNETMLSIVLGLILVWFFFNPENAGKWLGQIHKGYQIEMRAGDVK